MASQRNFTHISLIPEIITHIYKLLDLEDQLRLSRVDSQLKIMFKSFIWREEYRSLTVYKNPPYFAVTNETCENRLCLNFAQYKEFLSSYADDVLELTLHNTEVTPSSHDVNLKYFQNLVSFKYVQKTIPLSDVKVIAERNANLQELSLNSCFNPYKLDDQVIECIIHKMLNLKRLCIESFPMFDIELSKIQSILSETKLETLKLTAVIVWDEGLMQSKNANIRTNRLNDFNLHTIFDPQKWPSNCESYFRNLKSLTSLTITMFDKVTDEILAIVAETCNCLKTLRFDSTEFFDIKLFPVPSSVVEFFLNRCSGLTYENLKQILNQYSITKFYSSHTYYKGEFEDFHISPLIETLHITEAFDTLQHESTYKAINNLKDLVWYQSFPKRYITPSLSLKHCINLHTLEMFNCQIDLAALLELKSLRKLVMPHPVPLLEWLFITQLLQMHSSLRELVIKEGYAIEYRKIHLPLPCKLVSTQVHTICVPTNILSTNLDFWMDLFSGNKSLKLIICTAEPTWRLGEAIRSIVNHENFPKSMKTIDMCGFRTDCNFIRNHYHEYLKEHRIQITNSRHMYKDEQYRVTLYRK